MTGSLNAAAPRSAPPPFWLQLPRVFSYPAHLDPMVKIACFGVGATFAQFLPFGQLWVLLVWLGFLSYCFKVLERTARGHLLAQQGPLEERDGRDPRPFQQLVLIVLVVIVVALAALRGGVRLAQAATLLASVLLPASIMVLALEERLAAALNPLRILSTIVGIGLPYLALCAFLFLLLQGSGYLTALLAHRMPIWLGGMVCNLVAMYFLVSIYYLMGYALYQNHQALDIDVDVDLASAGRAMAPRGAEPDVLAPEVQAMIAEGHLDDAAHWVELALRNDWENDKLHERYHKLLLLIDKREPLEKHLNGYIVRLIRQGKLARAVTVYEAARQKQPEIALTDADALLPLAMQAFELRRDATALQLIHGFDKKFPGHADTAKVYLLAGRVLLERKNQYAQAERVFGALIQKFPQQQALVAEAGRLAQVAARMGAVERSGSLLGTPVVPPTPQGLI